MPAAPRRPRLIGILLVVALVGAAAIAAYAVGYLPSPAPESGLLSSTPHASDRASGESATETGDADANDSGSMTANAIPSGAFMATVSYVHDGDTLYLDNGSAEVKVRLIGIDTPELSSTQRPDAEECYGIEARDLLRDFLPEGTEVWALHDRESEDRYGRSLLYVYLQDGTFINLAMVELGAAEALKVGLNDRFWPELRNAEDEAYSAKLGMWSAC